MRNTFKFVVAVYVVFEREGKVLLLRRHNARWADGWFTPPAGHVEKGEGFVEAAVREAYEEAGVTVAPADMELFHISHHVYDQEDQCVDFFFKALKWQGDFVNAEPDKCDLMEWYAKDQLPEKTLRNIRAALEGAGDLRLKEFPFTPEEGMAR